MRVPSAPATIARRRVGESPSWLRHRILIPACEGSNPSSPARPLRCGLERPAHLRFDCAHMAYHSLMVFPGNATPKLAADVVKRLNIKLGRANVGRFSRSEEHTSELQS